MKNFAVLKVFFLVGCVQLVTCGNEQFPETFLDTYRKTRDSIFSSQTNLSDVASLKYKIDAFYEVSWQYGVGMRALRSVFMLLDSLRYEAEKIMATSGGLMEEISNSLDDFDSLFDQLNMQRDVSGSELASEINNLIDEFVKRHTETLAELFDSMQTQAEHLAEAVKKPANESSEMIDTLAEAIQKCLVIPKTDFKRISECRQETREIVLPTLSHNSALLGVIARDQQQLANLQLDGKTPVYQLFYDMRLGLFNLYQQIQELRDQREAEKENNSI